MAACIIRAIWSDAPPAPAATTISTGLVGSQAASAGVLAIMAVKAAAAFSICATRFLPYVFARLVKIGLAWCCILRANRREFKLQGQFAAYDFRMRRKSFQQGPWLPV